MKRTMFNDPRPLGHAEIVEALDELGMDPSEARAMIDGPDDDDGFGNKGFSATVDAPVEDEMEEFSTLAYPTKDQLLADLKAAGITDIEED